MQTDVGRHEGLRHHYGRAFFTFYGRVYVVINGRPIASYERQIVIVSTRTGQVGILVDSPIVDIAFKFRSVAILVHHCFIYCHLTTIDYGANGDEVNLAAKNVFTIAK